LLQGEITRVIPSPNGQLAAVVVNENLVIVNGEEKYLHKVAGVKNYHPKVKPLGEQYFRDQGFQWAPDSKSIFLIKDEYYESTRAQLFSKKGELWRFDVDSKTLVSVLSPFETFDYFLGSSGRVYFSTLDRSGNNLVLHAYDWAEVKNLHLKNDEPVDFGQLYPGEKEAVYYTFSSFEYETFVLRSLGLSVRRANKVESLFIGDTEVLKSTEGQGFKGPTYATRMVRSAFLPGVQVRIEPCRMRRVFILCKTRLYMTNLEWKLRELGSFDR